MKKIWLLIFIFIIFPIKTKALSARCAIVMDLNSGRVLYELNAHEKRLIASISKIMTSLVSIEYGDLNKVITADKDILKANGSSIYLEVGEQLKLEDLLYGLMLRSGNDSAVTIAKGVAGSLDSFVYLMNEYASLIGMENTYFVNPHGLDESGYGNISTAYDMALLTKVAMQNKTFRKIFNTTNYKAKSNIKTYNWEGKNKLFKMYKYTTGGKTGYTDNARRTLVTTASKDYKNLVIVTLNDPNDFSDHKALYETYFNKYDALKVLDKKTFNITNASYPDSIFYIKNDYYALVTKKEAENLKVDINLYKLDSPSDNTKIGEAKVLLGETILHEESIYIKNNKVIPKKSLWQKIKDWFKSW